MSLVKGRQEEEGKNVAAHISLRQGFNNWQWAWFVISSSNHPCRDLHGIWNEARRYSVILAVVISVYDWTHET